LYWLAKAKARFKISILDYMVTSNHIHLLALDNHEKSVIAQVMHLTAGRTAQEYNQRKNRSGAFWEDRYHATAIQTDNHLIKGLIYIDMNMVRAGVVSHPREWPYCGYQEIQGLRQRYTLIDIEMLAQVLGTEKEGLKSLHVQWTEEYLKSKKMERESRWTESIAIGNRDFVERIQNQLGVKAKGRKIVEKNGSFELKEEHTSYNKISPPKINSKP
jgi:putative transposase